MKQNWWQFQSGDDFVANLEFVHVSKIISFIENHKVSTISFE